MTSQGSRPKPLKPFDLRTIVLAALSTEGSYIEQPMSLHARFDHPERRIDLNDVLFGLRQE